MPLACVWFPRTRLAGIGAKRRESRLLHQSIIAPLAQALVQPGTTGCNRERSRPRLATGHLSRGPSIAGALGCQGRGGCRVDSLGAFDMGSHLVALARDVDDPAVMEQPIQQGTSHDRARHWPAGGRTVDEPFEAESSGGSARGRIADGPRRRIRGRLPPSTPLREPTPVRLISCFSPGSLKR